jgi:chorismate synthase
MLTSSTLGRVAAGAIAEKYLTLSHNVEIIAYVSSVGREHLFPSTAQHPNPSTNPDFLSLISTITRREVDSFIPVRCPDASASARMTKTIEQHRDNHDSIGGTVTCVIRNCPIGLGEPCFDKLEAMLAHAMLSIPATKGFEIGSGFGGCEVPGSVHNDPFILSPAYPTATTDTCSSSDPSQPRSSNQAQQRNDTNRRLTTKTNNSGGIQGGISNGSPIYFRVAFKPPATIGQAQTTTTYGFEEGVLEAKGRHDPCVVPRAVPIVESMAALVVVDALMAQVAREGARAALPKLNVTLKAAGVRTEEKKKKKMMMADKEHVSGASNGLG